MVVDDWNSIWGAGGGFKYSEGIKYKKKEKRKRLYEVEK